MTRWPAYGLLCLAACSARGDRNFPGGPMTHKDDMTTPLAIDVSVTGDGTAALTAHCVVRNTSSHPVHVFDSPRLPYLLDEPGALVVLHGVTPPPTDRDLNVIEIPVTRALAAGEALTFDVALVPLRLRGHYGDEPAPPARHGATTLVCRVGHGATPIDAAARPHTSIQALLAWQTLASSAPVTVHFP